MRSLVEVSAIAGNIYRRPDSSIKVDMFSAVASLAIMPAQAGDSLKTAVLHLRKSGITAKNVHAQTGVSGSVFSTPRNLDQLADNMKESWRMLGRNTDLLTSFCNSVQRRVRALYEAQGGATKY